MNDYFQTDKGDIIVFGFVHYVQENFNRLLNVYMPTNTVSLYDYEAKVFKAAYLEWLNAD